MQSIPFYATSFERKTKHLMRNSRVYLQNNSLCRSELMTFWHCFCPAMS